jgi:hypothetical protein
LNVQFHNFAAGIATNCLDSHASCFFDWPHKYSVPVLGNPDDVVLAGSAISCVIAFETCSLRSPSPRCCGNNSRQEIAVSGLTAKPIRDRRSQSTLPRPQGVGFHVQLNIYPESSVL